MLRPPPYSTLFPYTTLFRSYGVLAERAVEDVELRLSRRQVLQWDVSSAGFRIVESQVTLAERSEEHTSELQSQFHLVCRLLLEKKKAEVKGTWTPPRTPDGQ